MSARGGAASSRLREYRRKRGFDSTPEPRPGSVRRAARGSIEDGAGGGVPAASDGVPAAGEGTPAGEVGARFVVHEHHARRLHWDLRLEHEGSLASWAIPNGIPADPAHNRKAIRVEDHPLDYLDFEGAIPAGNYGAGEVMVWDRGSYTCEKWQSEKVIVVFHGERLRGRYALFHAGASPKDWMIHRMDPPVDPSAEEMPEGVQPMLARLSTLPHEESAWAFEVKWDGVRAIAYSQPGRIRLESRNGNDLTPAYPELRALNRALGSRAVILDGEIIAFDESGRPSFEALQPRMHQRGESAIRRLMRSTPVTYVLFDLLWLDGHSLMGLAYSERRARLEELALDGEHWRIPELQVGDGAQLLAATEELGLEGVVGKRLNSHYAPGGRDGSWIKIKHHRRQELVIGGWTDGRGARAQQIGALELGVYDEQGALRYAGRVGTGFDEDELVRLAGLLAPLAREQSPFTGSQPPRGAHFVAPQLVCEVEFSEWTRAGKVRQASYQGLREDRDPSEVVRERVVPVEAVGKPSVAPATLDPLALLGGGARVRGGVEVTVEGRALKLTNLDKVMFPRTGFTKGELIGAYVALAPVLLPHLHDRPLTLKRYPDGVEGEHFYEKHCPAHRPDWVQVKTVWSEQGRRDVDYCLCQDLPTLVWLANLAAIELHPSLSLSCALECPTTLAFDLDPGAPAGIVQCCEVALQLRDLLGELGLRAFAKTSGSKGLQVYVPLNTPETTYEWTKSFARTIAELMAHGRPEFILAEMTRARRAGKVLIDWSQNDEHKTTISVYSLRAKEAPTVSVPLRWEEVETAHAADDPTLLELSLPEVLERVHEHGDLFAQVASLRQTLPAHEV